MTEHIYKIDWGSLIIDIVKKKDLDCKEFKDCRVKYLNALNLVIL